MHITNFDKMIDNLYMSTSNVYNLPKFVDFGGAWNDTEHGHPLCIQVENPYWLPPVLCNSNPALHKTMDQLQKIDDFEICMDVKVKGSICSFQYQPHWMKQVEKWMKDLWLVLKLLKKKWFGWMKVYGVVEEVAILVLLGHTHGLGMIPSRRCRHGGLRRPRQEWRGIRVAPAHCSLVQAGSPPTHAPPSPANPTH